VEIFVTRWVARFTRKERIKDALLIEAVSRIERGLIDADLGGGLLKVRVARPGQGRSSGYRMVLAYRVGRRVVFFYGFAKNEFANVQPHELVALREYGGSLLRLDEVGIAEALADGSLQEIEDGGAEEKA
jgi:hypothetical protein